MRLSILLLALVGVALAAGNSVPGRYLVELRIPPAKESQTPDADRVTRERVRGALVAAGATVLSSTEVVSSTFSIEADAAAIERIRAIPEVTRIRKVRALKQHSGSGGDARPK